jgi:hypothetical protein
MSDSWTMSRSASSIAETGIVSGLRNADGVLAESAEHFVRVSGDRVAVHPGCAAEEEQSAAFLRRRHRANIAAGNPIVTAPV